MEKLTMAIVLGQAGRQGGDTVWGEPWWYDGVNDELLQQHVFVFILAATYQTQLIRSQRSKVSSQVGDKRLPEHIIVYISSAFCMIVLCDRRRLRPLVGWP